MLTCVHKTQRLAFDFTFLEWYLKDGDEFLNPIIQVTGNETCILFHSLNKLKKFKQTSTCKKVDSSCFLGQERRPGGGIHATKDHNVTSVLQNAEKTA
jgi:hypothetical protein